MYMPMLTPDEVKAHKLDAEDLAERALEIEEGSYRLADGMSAAMLAPTLRRLLAREMWAQSHAVYEWMEDRGIRPKACTCPLWCAPKA
jgi:hypothetical protein